MPSLTVFVATTRTQGRRANDFAHIEGPELVDLAMTCDRDRGNPDGGCGCARAFTGLDSGRGTTTAEVAVRDLTLVQYRNIFHRRLVAFGFDDDPDLRREAEQAADEMAHIAARWPVGAVVERRGDTIAVRAWPTTSTNGRRNLRQSR
ncbi:DUF7715 family protein [Actinophytocola xanthii]|uniref:DUF7715 domain-containing protein n=1 Tax=Actinophytocola xanthii TaxID=1912961 RepID=A0A1Q8C2G2_9PSEU|nr:hypothetical protein [Actinophytocola xanthii]OLF08567.1 hypothetical protein BU204_34305 [Actinophytocola xanthii]